MFKKQLIKASGATAALLLVASTAAMAGPPTYITVNGISSPSAAADVNGASSGTIGFLTDYGVPVSCSTSALTAKAYRGALVAATNPIGRITGMTGSSCIATALNFPVTVAMNPGDWDIKVKTVPAAAGQPIPVEVKNVSITFGSSGGPCHFSAAAGSAGVPATLTPGPIGGNDARIIFTPSTGYPLVISTPSGSATCGGQVYPGDLMNVAGTYNLTTTGAITGPISHG